MQTIYSFLLQLTGMSILCLLWLIVFGNRLKTIEGLVLVADVLSLALAILSGFAFVAWAGDQENHMLQEEYRTKIFFAYTSRNLDCKSFSPREHSAAIADSCKLLLDELLATPLSGRDMSYPLLIQGLNGFVSRLQQISDRQPPRYAPTSDIDKMLIGYAIRDLKDVNGLSRPFTSQVAWPDRYLFILYTAFLAVFTATLKLYISLRRKFGEKLERIVGFMNSLPARF